jgi:hypothetical protein
MVEWLRDNHKLGQIVVLHLGNNGTVGDSTVEEMFQALKDVPQVIVVNVRVTQPWQDAVNATLAAHAASHPNVKLVDWLTLSAPHPDYFYSDGTHLRPLGAEFYSAVITQALAG